MIDRSQRSVACLDAETLAAFVDHTLDAEARARAEAHLADCEDCYEALVEMTRVGRDLDADVDATEQAAASNTTSLADRAPTPRRGSSRSRRVRTWVPIISLLAASAAAIVWLRPQWLPFGGPDRTTGSAMADLVRAVGRARFTEARLSDGFAWGPAPIVVRGTIGTPPPIRTQQAALKLRELAETTRTAETLRGAGVALMATGDVDAAITSLDDSLALASGNWQTHLDLSAALLERWRRDQINVDATRALNEAEIALETSRTPPALFDRALALEATGAIEAAAATWDDYLKLDASSGWAKEARDHLTALRARMKSAKVDVGAIAGSPTALADAAQHAPLALYQFLTSRVLEPWADATSHDRPFDLASGHAVSVALRGAGRDLYLPDTLDAAEASVRWLPARRQCLASAIIAMRASRAESEDSNYEDAKQDALKAEAQFLCAGTTPIDAKIQQAWNTFFSDRRQDAVPAARLLAGEANDRRYLHVAARIAYLDGLLAGGDGRFTESLAHFDDALRTYTEAADTEQIAATETQTAAVFDQCGDQEAAWRHLDAALSELDQVDRPRIRYLVFRDAQSFAANAGYLQAAVVFSRELNAIAAGWTSPFMTTDAASNEADLLRQLGQPGEAAQAIAVAKRTLPKIADVKTRAQYETLIGWTEAQLLQTSNPDAAVLALAPVFDRMARADLPQTLAQAYLIRGRANATAGRAVEARADWLKGIAALEDRRAGITDAQLSISRTSELWDLYAEFIRATIGDANPEISLAIAERARSRALLDARARDRQATPLAPPHLHDWLPENATALVYAALSDRLVLWRVTRHRVDVITYDVSRARLGAMVQTYVASLRSPDLRESNGDELAALLLPPDLAADPTALLAILPDGPLNALPFAVLVNPRTHHRLVEDFVPVVEPSLTIMKSALAAPRPRPAMPLIIGYGAAQPAFGLSALPQVQAETAEVARIHEGPSPLVGVTATRTTILRALPSATLIHFAGHAIANERYPDQAQFFVAPDATGNAITPTDISTTRLIPGTVVVLSTCDAARGRTYQGEGTLNLARPFLAAGASAVVASLWSVEDADASAFVIGLHTQLANGSSVMSALADAQRAALHSGGAVRRWAGWIVIGATSDKER